MTGLHLAPGLDLPPEAALQRFGILAMSGAGKSNTAVVMAEEMYDNDIPWVAIDPKGDWWGVRAGADGKRDGLAVPVFGGLHGDVPLEPTAGKVVAELVAGERLTCVLDVSEFDTRQQLFRFLADFAETLLRKNQDPLHLFLEEADDYLPQRAGEKGELPRCLGAWTRVVKRGRYRGIFATLISQRSASLSKDVLTQIDTLIPMRITSPQDRKAIEGWVVEHQGAKELLASLGELADGEAWVWSPQRLKVMERVRFRRRRTFDSGETPKLGEERKAARLADVDLEAVEARMKETIERAKADDPGELKKRIRELEGEKRSLEIDLGVAKNSTAEPIVETVEVPVVPREAVEALTAFSEQTQRLHSETVELNDRVHRYVDRIDRAIAELIAAPIPSPQAGAAGPGISTSGDRSPRPSPAPGTGDLGKGAPARFLAVLAQHPDGRTKRQLSIQAGVSIKSSTFRGAMADLRRDALVDSDRDRVWLTDAGRAAAADVPPLPTGHELIDYWRTKLGTGAPRKLFDALVDAYPGALTRDHAARRAETQTTSSTWRGAMARLRALDLIDVVGDELQASEELMGGA